MASLYAEIEIDAPKHLVWEALVSKERWKLWNTFLFDRDPSKPLQQGKEVSLSFKRLPREAETEIQPIITLIEPECRLEWICSIPGLKNEHVFELQESGSERTKYFHKDNFSGILERVFFPFIREDEQQGIKRMARELKSYLEFKI